MSTLSIRIPDSIHAMVKEIAKTDNVSINQFISSAIGEKIAALETENYLEKRGLLGSKESVDKILKKVPNIEPEDFDK
ncbi:MAG: DUF6290 family protein [Spirochaetales bacterium]|nr:DUF6290 family protein [Spirochaetales bacterium]